MLKSEVQNCLYAGVRSGLLSSNWLIKLQTENSDSIVKSLRLSLAPSELKAIGIDRVYTSKRTAAQEKQQKNLREALVAALDKGTINVSFLLDFVSERFEEATDELSETHTPEFMVKNNFLRRTYPF